MGRLDLFVAHVLDTPWAVLPSRGRVLLGVLLRRCSGLRLSDWQVEEVVGRDRDRYAARREGDARLSGRGVAVLPIFGLLAHRQHEVENASGGGVISTESVTAAVRAADADPQVGTLLLDIDSPGGSVFGVEELADVIAATEKPVVAVANSLAASGAYWIASQADELIVTPSGEVGSIGVYAIHEDLSVAMELEGVTPTIISAGKFKAEGNPLEPLSTDARAAIQRRVDDYYGAFVRAVARGRGVTPAAVRDGFAEGRVVGGKESVQLGMADRVATMEETVARLLAGGRIRKRGARASQEGAAVQIGPVAFPLNVVLTVATSGGSSNHLITEHRADVAAPDQAGTEFPLVDDTDLRQRELDLIAQQAGTECPEPIKETATCRQ